MSEWPKLPPRRGHMGEEAPVCPWCGADMEALLVPWESVGAAHNGGGAVVVSGAGACPDCGRPVKVVERRRAGTMTGHTLAELTEKDRQYVALVLRGAS